MGDLGLAAESVTFLDTPGHAAFYRMRAKGANKQCSDLAVIVIDVTDGLRPQTHEVQGRGGYSYTLWGGGSGEGWRARGLIGCVCCYNLLLRRYR
jgi:hypothetical protein